MCVCVSKGKLHIKGHKLGLSLQVCENEACANRMLLVVSSGSYNLQPEIEFFAARGPHRVGYRSNNESRAWQHKHTLAYSRSRARVYIFKGRVGCEESSVRITTVVLDELKLRMAGRWTERNHERDLWMEGRRAGSCKRRLIAFCLSLRLFQCTALWIDWIGRGCKVKLVRRRQMFGCDDDDDNDHDVDDDDDDY